jgi:hypothetical protein
LLQANPMARMPSNRITAKRRSALNIIRAPDSMRNVSI